MTRLISKRGFFRTGTKYGARKVRLDNHIFDSQREARRYGELRIFERDGFIRNLSLQPAFPISIAGQHICTYIADFEYEERQPDGSWVVIHEDVKSPATARNALYRLKRRLVAALYPEAEIREIY